MITRRIQVCLGICLLLTVVTVYHNARYVFYSGGTVPVRVQSTAGNITTIESNDSTLLYHGYSRFNPDASQSQLNTSFNILVHNTLPRVYQVITSAQITNSTNSQRNFATFLNETHTSRGRYSDVTTVQLAAPNNVTAIKHDVTNPPGQSDIAAFNTTHAHTTVHHLPGSAYINLRPVHPRIEDYKKPVRVLLLSYQRSGSSIISSLFGDNPSVFFLYEPLDSVYTALYGLAPGWSVPADLTINRDGSLRKMPELENNTVVSFLQNVYECQFDKVPTEFLIHPFWWYFTNWTEQARPYVSCLRAHGLSDRSLAILQRTLAATCGKRFGDIRSKQGKCYGRLWPSYVGSDIGNGGLVRGLFRNVRAKPHMFFYNSLSQMKKKASYCVNKYLKEPCMRTPFRAVKTVRATMGEAGALMQHDPDLKVIHLLRDPRGVTRSRLKATWSRGFYDLRNEGHVAHVYCDTGLGDYNTSLTLSRKYPGRIMHLTLEQFVRNPEAQVEKLQDFLGIRLGSDALHKIYKRMKPGFLDKWRTEMSSKVVNVVNSECKDFMTKLNIPL